MKTDPTVSFDPVEEIMFVGFASITISTTKEIEHAFQVLERFWKHECEGQKVYAVIDYTDFSLDISLTAAWATAVKRAVENISIVALRFTNDLAGRATLRAVAVKIHHPSNLYATREDAIAVVRGLRSKKIALEAG